MLFPLDLWLEDPAPVWFMPEAPKFSAEYYRAISAEILRRRKR